MPETVYTQSIKNLIDSLKAKCANAGLSGDPNEYLIVTQTFLYKFLNDKFLHEVAQKKPQLTPENITKELLNMPQNEYDAMLFGMGGTVKLKPQHLISYLYSKQNEPEFYKLFDETLFDVATENSGIFSVHTAENQNILLFEDGLFGAVKDPSERNSLAKAVINLLVEEKIDFSKAFNQGFDFFSTIFEYMIADYNTNGGGKYAEYYTPRAVAKIMAEILIGSEDVQNVNILDPSAGSGTLLMSLANKIGVDKCSVYSQDISQKSSNLLRLNLILNNLIHSISNVVQGNTISNPAHADILRQKGGFDYIVSNPPFNVDFSQYRDEIANSEANTTRFFAGVPSIPKKKKESMSIYLLFLQHVMHYLKTGGKAAIVVPTGFITAQSGIEKKIREKLIQNNWLKGVISMPSNIFANTGTQVSVVFIDKSPEAKRPVFIDASKLGKTIKDGKNQRTVLSSEDEFQIVQAFKKPEDIEDFSVHPSVEEIKAKNYSFSAGQYFDIKIEHIDITEKEFKERMVGYENELKELFAKSNELEKEILESLGRVEIDE